MMVVDKPAGVVVHPAPGHRRTTLVEHLAERAGGSFEPLVVHRLDRDTSGLMLVAKSRAGPTAAPGADPPPRGRARVPGAGEGAPRRERRNDRDAARPRRAPANAYVVENRDAETGADPLHRRAIPRRVHPGPSAARDWADAPDPRPFRGDGPSGQRRSRVRRPAACSGSSGSSSTARGWRSRTPRAVAGSSCAPPCPRTSRRRSRDRNSVRRAGNRKFPGADPFYRVPAG